MFIKMTKFVKETVATFEIVFRKILLSFQLKIRYRKEVLVAD